MAQESSSKTTSTVLLGLVGLMFVVSVGLYFIAPVDKTTRRPDARFYGKVVGFGALGEAYPWRDRFNRPVERAIAVSDLRQIFKTTRYDLVPILLGEALVPRLFLNALPTDLKDVKDTSERKSLFFRTLLPLVLAVNDTLANDRRRVLQLRHRLNLAQKIPLEDQIWLNSLFKTYRVENKDFESLLIKLDSVPPSLILAQAAEESGWGTSRFVREGNALFGQWTFNPKDKGIVPAGRAAGKTHRIKAFDSIGDSLADYVLNLNRHKAYRGMRAERLELRRKGDEVTGFALARGLEKYSERGEEYVTSLQAIISKNKLGQFDQAKLDTKILSNDQFPAIWTSSDNKPLTQ